GQDGAFVHAEGRPRRTLLEDGHDGVRLATALDGTERHIALQRRREAGDEVAQRLAVAGEAAQRDPLPRPVMARAHRPERDGRGPGWADTGCRCPSSTGPGPC